MSITAIKTVLEHSKNSGTAKLVMVCIAEHWNEKSKTAWPSVNRLMKYCNVSKQSVHNALKACKKSGELDINYKAGPHGNNMYTFNLPGLESKTKSQDSKADFTVNEHNVSSILDGKVGLTVKNTCPNSKADFTETVKQTLLEPLITLNNPNLSSNEDSGKSQQQNKTKKSPLSPETEPELLLFEIINRERVAKELRPAQRFQTLPQKEKCNKEFNRLGKPEFEKCLDYWITKGVIAGGDLVLKLEQWQPSRASPRHRTNGNYRNDNSAKGSSYGSTNANGKYSPKSWAETQREKQQSRGG